MSRRGAARLKPFRARLAVAVAIAAAASLLAAPAAASAAETIGIDIDPLDATTNPTDPEGDGSRHVFALGVPLSLRASGGLTADSAGVVTRFRVKFGFAFINNPRLALRVYDQIDSDTFLARESSAPVDPVLGSTHPYPTRIPIATGETIGIDIVPGMADQSVVFFHDPGMAGINSRSASGDAGPLAPGSQGDFIVTSNSLPLLNADVEPDADADGFGDESQDACPTDPGTQAACPAPAAAGATKKKRCKKRKRRGAKHAAAAKTKKKKCKRKRRKR
jgi:hypothetical protein